MAKAEVYRIVLAQNSATLWTDLAIQNERWIEKKATEAREDKQDDEDDEINRGWTEEETVELESRILVSLIVSYSLSVLIRRLLASDDGTTVSFTVDSGDSRIEYDAQSNDLATAETEEILSYRRCGRGGWRERETGTRGEREVDEDWRRRHQSS